MGRSPRHVALYRRLLVLYPRSFHQEYGDAVVQLFADLVRAAHGPGRRLGLARLWIGTGVDLLTSSTRQRIEEAMSDHPGRTRILLVAVPVAAIAVLSLLGTPPGALVAIVGVTIVVARRRSVATALAQPRANRWWIAPVVGLGLIGLAVGLPQLLPGPGDVKWGLSSLVFVAGAVTVIASLVRTLALAVRRPATGAHPR